MDNRETLAQLLNTRSDEGAPTLAEQLNERSREGGEIQWMSHDRKYGFIKQDRRDADLFFHHSELEVPIDQVRFGDRVTYEVAIDRRPGKDPRFCAQAVRLDNGGEK